LFASAQSLSQEIIARRQRRQALEQCPEIKTSATHHYRQTSARRYPGDHLTRRAGIIAGGETCLGVQDVQKMMRHATAFSGGCLGRADIEAAVELEGVAIDDFTRENFGGAQC